MYSEIMSAIEGVRAAKEVISASNDLRNFNEITSTLSKVYADLIAAQESAISAQQARAALEQEIGLLKEEVVRLKDVKAQLERFELKPLALGMHVYAHKPGMENGEPAHYLCQNCASQFEVSRLQPLTVGRKLMGYVCHRCKAQVR